MEINALTAAEIVAGVKSKKFSATEIARAASRAAAAENEKIHSYITLSDREALQAAEKVDKKIAAGEDPGPLAGVPVAIKDNLMVKGVRTTCASKILGDYVAPYDAFVIERLRDAGAVFVGKTNLDEFAMGSSTEFSAFGGTKNPWDLDRVPGGSSGGSAATVAARSVPLSLGSDTGGSIRQPASFCGVIGMKPTYGTVSRYGLVAFASSLDQIGPFAADPRDLALLLSVIAGRDSRDSTCVDRPAPDFLSSLGRGVKGLKLGLPKEYFIEGTDPAVNAAVRGAAASFRKLGAEIVDISLPHTDAAVAAYYIVAPSEASSNLARFDGMRYGFRDSEAKGLIEQYFFNRRAGFGSEVKRRIMIGTYALSSGYYDAYYSQAQRVRTLIKQDFAAAFDKVDLILGPTAPTPPFKAGEKTDDPLQMYLSDIFTIPANLAGIPAVSIPCGQTADGLPIGVQLAAKAFDDATLVRAADAFLGETAWNRKRPEGLKLKI